jgi:hypothetical protein
LPHTFFFPSHSSFPSFIMARSFILSSFILFLG